MKRPLALFLMASVFASLAAAQAPEHPDRPKIPKELREKACADGAYLRPKQTAQPAKKASAKTKTKGKETPEGETSLPAGDDFAPVGGDFGDMFKFTPEGDDCSGFDKLFTRGPNGSPAPADALEIAPASIDGKPLTPEEARKHFTSLASLSNLPPADADLVKRFFDGNTTQGDKDLLKKSDAALAAAALMPPPDDAVQADGSGAPREPLVMSEPKKFSLKSKMPELGASPPIRPLQGAAPAPPPDSAPYEPGPIRRYYNNAKAEIIDYFHGSPIANAEGEREVLPNPTPIYSAPGSDQSVTVRLPQGPGVRPSCEPGCYGTQKMISVLVGMGEDYSAYYKGAQAMSVGGISKYGGGYFPPHVSHQHGIDADISFARGGGGFDALANAMIVAAAVRKMPDFKHINGREYILVDQSKHAAVGWGLDQLVAQGNLTPEQAARGKSVLVHWPNHNDHFHVRILP